MYSFDTLAEFVCTIAPLTDKTIFINRTLSLYSSFIFVELEVLEVYCPYNLEYVGKVVFIDDIPYMFDMTKRIMFSEHLLKNLNDSQYYMLKLTPI